MLKDITWTNYLIGAGAAIMVYLTTVVLLYFRKEVAEIFNKKDGLQEQEFPNDEEEVGNSYESTGELMDDLERTVEEIKKRILVPGNKATKPQLLEQLKGSVANFGGLSRPGYRIALTNFIRETAKDICGVDFSEEELEQAWMELPR